MAKKTISKFKDDDISNALISRYGDVIKSGTEVIESLGSYETVSVSPALDLALGGGIREGTCVAMTGDPKTGKTTTALHFAAKCQKLGKEVLYFNTEGRLELKNFEGIKGLDPSKIKVIESTDDRVLTAEEFLNMIETYVNSTPDMVAIIDSVSNMVPEVELEGEIRTGVRNALPRLLSMFFKRVSGSVSRTKAILIFITHNIANTSGSRFAPAKMADAGNMLQYQVSTNMVITHRGKWEVPKESGNHVGQIANWIIKTSSNGTPMSKAESWIKYGVGIDEVQEVIQIACEFRLIKAAGAWYTIRCAVDKMDDKRVKKVLKDNEVAEGEEAAEKFFKFQGVNRLSEFLTDNEPIAELVYEEVRELLDL
jgi:recombination protein RecA